MAHAHEDMDPEVAKFWEKEDKKATKVIAKATTCGINPDQYGTCKQDVAYEFEMDSTIECAHRTHRWCFEHTSQWIFGHNLGYRFYCDRCGVIHNSFQITSITKLDE